MLPLSTIHFLHEPNSYAQNLKFFDKMQFLARPLDSYSQNLQSPVSSSSNATLNAVLESKFSEFHNCLKNRDISTWMRTKSHFSRLEISL